MLIHVSNFQKDAKQSLNRCSFMCQISRLPTSLEYLQEVIVLTDPFFDNRSQYVILIIYFLLLLL